MNILLHILAWLGFAFGVSVAKYYFFAVTQPPFNRPQMFFSPIGHVLCLMPIALGVWSAFFIPWWAIALLAVIAPNALVLLGDSPREADDRKWYKEDREASESSWFDGLEEEEDSKPH